MMKGGNNVETINNIDKGHYVSCLPYERNMQKTLKSKSLK